MAKLIPARDLRETDVIAIMSFVGRDIGDGTEGTSVGRGYDGDGITIDTLPHVSQFGGVTKYC
jgi:hypothetical protein